MCGGNSANTDRKATLFGYGNAESAIKRLGGLSGNLNAQGAEDTGKAAKHYSDILSGNPAAVMAAAAPEVNAITKGADTQKKDVANFGNRTGGTNATTQAISTETRGQVGDTIAKERGDAASGLTKIGESEQSKGLQALTASGDQSLSLSSVSGQNREVSAKLHDAAVKQWADLVQQAFTAATTGSSTPTLGVT